MQIWFLLKIAFSFGSIAAGQQRWDSSSLAAGHKPPPPQYPSPPPAADGMRNKGSPGALSSPKQPKNPTSTSTTDHEPCAQLAAIANSMMAANPKGPILVPGELAYECLNSVPLHKTEALAVAKSILPYAMFHSGTEDLPYKLNPPADYPYKPVDLIASLNKIVDNLTADVYPNEYAWQADTFRVMMSAKDGHFRFIGDLLGKVVFFGRRISLVSVSTDGVALPVIYMFDDINKTRGAGQSFTPSPVKQINGQDAVSFVTAEADLGFQQDPDSAYNTMFFSPVANYFPGSPQYGYFGGDQRYGVMWPGPNTTFAFANGSTLVVPTMATVKSDLSGIVDGESLYQRFCTGPKPKAKPSNSSAPADDPGNNNQTIQLTGYPKPQVGSTDGTVSSYYLKSEAHKDVAVLAITSFSPDNDREFQSVIQTALAEMKRDGKDKLVVDLSVNGGGLIYSGIDAFRQLFPTTQDQTLGRFRSHAGLQEMVQATSELLPGPLNPANASLDIIGLALSHYNYHLDLDVNRKSFPSADAKFIGPTINDIKFSNVFQVDYNDPLLTSNDTTGAGMDITGYGSRTNFIQPFPPSNIVMLFDGVCASTCTLFSELMRNQGSVKSISIGGRPTKTQIQTIGGVKGAQENGYKELHGFIELFSTLGNPVNTPANRKKFPHISMLSDLPINRSIDTGVNVQDHILAANLKDGLPAQYVREEADCRLYYTPEMVLDVTKIWEAAANAAFGGKPCVAGGIEAPKRLGRRQAFDRELWRRREMPRLRREVGEARKLLEIARRAPGGKSTAMRRVFGRGRGVPRIN